MGTDHPRFRIELMDLNRIRKLQRVFKQNRHTLYAFCASRFSRRFTARVWRGHRFLCR